VQALIVLKGANHCQWTSATSGVCSVAECHNLTHAEQHAAGRLILGAFLPAALGSQPWDTFEQFLAKGSKEGQWEYITMNSPANTNLTNNCPCK